MKRLKITKKLILQALAAALVFLAVCSYLYAINVKERYIFHPVKEVYNTPEPFGLKYEDLTLQTFSGQVVNAWYVPGPDENAPAILLLSGNGGNMTALTDRVVLFHQIGFSVMTVDYPGYGRSTGKPSENASYEAAEAAWRHLTSEKGYKPAGIAVYGFSLGGGVASWLAARRQPGALILDSTFTCLADVPAFHKPDMSFLFHLILWDDFDTKSRLDDIKAPLLVFHSSDDEVVPYALGKELYEAYENGPKMMFTGHGTHTGFALNLDVYLPPLKSVVNDLKAATQVETQGAAQ